MQYCHHTIISYQSLFLLAYKMKDNHIKIIKIIIVNTLYWRYNCSIIKLGVQGKRSVLNNIKIKLFMQIHFYNKYSFMSEFYQTI